MSKTVRFRGPLDKQHATRHKALLKSASQNIYPIHWSLPTQLGLKKSLLFTCQILGLLLNTLAPNEKYPVLNRDNLTIQIQMQLSQKQKSFSEFVAIVSKSRLNFEHFEKRKMALTAFVVQILRTLKTWLGKCLKSPITEEPPRTNVVNVPKHCWNLHHSIFIRFTDYCRVMWVGKNLCYWHGKSWDSFLTHCLPMKSILFFKGTI